ncbi:MAG: efflux RND transporter periplasmic adaptor subunit [Deltaproteobacteria bacterium]|jgi:RND family efflux transporter MFP subunit|nr:efflux RND transporter periplasmic adaptor subunit [Deltaproteobacteria bacterium]
MSLGHRKTWIIFFVAVFCSAILGWLFFSRSAPPEQTNRSRNAKSDRTAPVEVAQVIRGEIEMHRTFSGTLEARAEFVVAPKVSGRLERITVNIADPVEPGQLIAELDSEEYVQAVAQARADLEVAKANLVEAQNALEIAQRELSRFKTLRQRGVASESQFDSVKANELARQSELEVAQAQVVRAESALETARIRLGYTRILAGLNGDDSQKVVAERYVDPGDTVSANTPLLRIVELDPITGVIFVSERDYAQLSPGQDVILTTDAYPNEEFKGQIERIAPIFKQETRQARVELKVANPDHRLKPGMFIRTTIVLVHVADALIIPETALTKRQDKVGIFLVSEDGQSVHWQEVELGIQGDGQVQILNETITGQVVTLGHQMLDDGSAIIIPAEQEPADEKTNKVSH